MGGLPVARKLLRRLIRRNNGSVHRHAGPWRVKPDQETPEQRLLLGVAVPPSFDGNTDLGTGTGAGRTCVMIS